MGLVTPGGSGDTKSPSTVRSVATNKATVKDTFINRTSISPHRYSEIYGSLLGSPRGHEIEVDYFHRNESIINNQTSEVDYSIYRHSIHTNFTKIIGFKFRLEQEFDISYDEEQTIMTISGTAKTFPGFNPHIGDLFLYILPDSQLGIFIVENIERLTIQQTTGHRINFRLVEYGDHDLGNLEKIESSVSETFYFDKQKYLNKNFTLLTDDTYTQLKKLRQYRPKIVEYLFKKHFSNELNSIVRHDGIYDPYVVEFIQAKVSFFDVDKTPVQIYPEVTDYQSSLWFLLTGATDSDIESLEYTYYSIKDIGEIWDVNFTGILNRKMIHLDDSKSINHKHNLLILDPNDFKTYVLSHFFYEENLEKMSDLESMVYTTIEDPSGLDIAKLLTMVKDYRKIPEEDRLYHLCIYIYLIDIAIENIA